MSTIASTHDDTYSQRSSSTDHEGFHPPQEEDNGEMRISEKYLKKLFRDNYGLYYNTFELNEKLYLHYKGFKKIENLHRFPDLKCIYLEGNGLTKIEGFDTNHKLRSVYIHENLFEKIENLNHLKELHYLNLNDNYITKIEGLNNMPDLSTLQIKKNRVGKNGISDLLGLLEIPSLSVLDVSENLIDDPAVVDEVLVKMPNLAVLYLKGNPVCKKIKNYKKTVIAKMPNLKYLDDSPVFPEDRRYAEAFYAGGLNQEREERKKVKQEKDEEHWRNHQAFRDMIRKAKEKKEQEEGKKQQQDSESEVALTIEYPPKVEELKEEPVENDAQCDDMPPELEEVAPEDMPTEKNNQKVQELINQLAARNDEIGDDNSESNKTNKSIVDINHIKVQNSNSISLSVTSETLEDQKQTNEDVNDSKDYKEDESEEEKHLEDSTSEVDEESAKSEPGVLQEELNESESSKHNYSNAKSHRHDENGEYLDELD